MKKIVSVLAVIVLLIGCMTVAAFAVEAKPSDTVTVNISLTDNPGIGSFDFVIDYDATRLESPVLTKGSISSGNLTVNSEDGLAVIWYDTENSTFTGTIATVTFKVKADAPDGEAAVTISELSVSKFVGDGEAEATAMIKADPVTVKHDHVWGEWETTKAATCAEEGQETRKCTAAGCTETETRAIPVTSHTLVRTEAKAATETAEGNIEYWSCSVCGKFFKDADGKTEITKADTVIAKLTPKTDDTKTEEPKQDDAKTTEPDDQPGDKPSDKPGDKPDAKPDKKPDDVPGDAPADKPDGTPGDAPADLLKYEFLEGGADSKWAKGASALHFRVDVDFEKFVEVRIDGKVVDKANYEAKAGSTVIDLKASYLETLKNGKHTMTVVFDDGEAAADFEVSGNPEQTTAPTQKPDDKKPDDGKTAPKAGDESMIALWAVLFTVTAAAAVVIGTRKKAGK